MLVTEVPAARLWQLLKELRDSGEKSKLVLPSKMPPADEVKALVRPILQKDKGSGYAGRLIELCDVAELPPTVVAFLNIVYGAFKRPEPVPPIEPEETEAFGKCCDFPNGRFSADPIRQKSITGCELCPSRSAKSANPCLMQQGTASSWVDPVAEKLRWLS